MSQQYVGPVNEIDWPAFVMLRECHEHFDGKSRVIPIAQVPVERRTGSLLMIYAANGLVIPGSETGLVYPRGATFTDGRNCQVYLEVYPRGKMTRDYHRYCGESVRLVYMAGLDHTPLALVPRPAIYPKGTRYVQSPHLTVLPASRPDQVGHYLRGSLPLIGVDPRDVDVVISRLSKLITAGRSELDRLPQRPRR